MKMKINCNKNLFTIIMKQLCKNMRKNQIIKNTKFSKFIFLMNKYINVLKLALYNV